MLCREKRRTEEHTPSTVRRSFSNRYSGVTEVIIAESVGELTEASLDARAKSSRPLFKDDRLRSDWSFFGRKFNSHEEVRKAATEPWNEGGRLVDSMLRELESVRINKPTSRRRRVVFDEFDGDEIDRDRLMSGQPFWRQAKRRKIHGQGTITVCSDMRAAGAIDAEDVLWRGAASILLTKLLEEAGYRVQLWTAQAERDAFNDGSDMFVAAMVKDHRQPLDMETSIAAVSAWFYRIIGFQAAHIASEEHRGPTKYCGYDRAEGVRPFLDDLSKDEKKFIVEGIWSRRKALEFIEDAIATIEQGMNTVSKWEYSPWNRKIER